jgi:hypothetical protein
MIKKNVHAQLGYANLLHVRSIFDGFLRIVRWHDYALIG